MKVKSIYFIKCIPGEPVYKMTNGSLRIPMSVKGKTGLYWISEEEVTKGVSDVDRKSALAKPFRVAEKEIESIERDLLKVS